MSDDELRLKIKCTPSIDRICYIVTLPENVGRPDRVEAAVQELLLAFTKAQRADEVRGIMAMLEHVITHRTMMDLRQRAKELEKG